MQHIPGTVSIWEQQSILPTYEVGEAEKLPMFLEKRVYQGSSGRVYPLPITDKIYDKKTDKTYTTVHIENDFLSVIILPELGGRIQRAYDKTNGYDFVYYNEVIKPALIGLTGPWISGGIEFNWPQHHRPTTYSPVEYIVKSNDDGSKSMIVSEVDRMYGTKCVVCLTLYADKSYIEIKANMYNYTPFLQTFLWWANPAVPVNNNTQSIFPPDVNAVMDHGKRAVSKFPIATGEYYKFNYGDGVDISRYKNIQVPTSYMAYRSDYDFVGGYDYAEEAGILHVADHHISPGKKQWTWGCGDFGQAWDRNLTDENGPYIELMTGVYADNQPDFTWLKPFGEKSFTQYFMPYKKAGMVKNATKDIVISLNGDSGVASICVYSTNAKQHVEIVLSRADEILLKTPAEISPNNIFEGRVDTNALPEELTLAVYDLAGKKLVSYSPHKKEIEKIPDPAVAAKLPGELFTNEELYLTALHLEQYRHATCVPDDYYIEGLKRDKGDIRINTAYGNLLLRRGHFGKSEKYFRIAIQRLTWKNPNPYDSEAYCGLGIALLKQGNIKEAFDSFYKATWTDAQQEMAFYYLASISSIQKEYGQALEFAEKALVKNAHNAKARALKGVLLLEIGEKEAAKEWLHANIYSVDPFDHTSHIALSVFEVDGKEKVLGIIGDNPYTFIVIASDYAEWGFYAKAAEVLRLSSSKLPMLKYYEAYYMHKIDGQNYMEVLQQAAVASPDYCFPNSINDVLVLEYAIKYNPQDSKAMYYLGNLFYDKRRYDEALKLWEESSQADPSFAIVWRNLAIAYYNKKGDIFRAEEAMEKAFLLDSDNPRILMELDQLYKKLNKNILCRMELYEKNKQLVEKRDDLLIEYVTLLNLHGEYTEALYCIMQHTFHPWEGDEGKITAQYTGALVELAKESLALGEAAKAEGFLRKALVLPENLGEGKLAGAKDNNIFYWLGIALIKQDKKEEATEVLQKACLGDAEISGAIYYYDQPADMVLYQGLAYRRLGNEKQAKTLFNRLVDYGERHIYDSKNIDFFAVSLPGLQVFDQDMSLFNKANCQYLIALGSIGLGDKNRAIDMISLLKEQNNSHQGIAVLSKMIDNII